MKLSSPVGKLALLGVWALTSTSWGCTCSKQTQEAPSQDSAPSAAASAASSDEPSSDEPSTEPSGALSKGHPVPMGPRLIVDPGQGLGAIRFGATVATIERHMGAPCDIETDNKCIYVRQAVEFDLKDGVASEMKAHRRDRLVQPAGESAPSGKPAYYGTFRGILFPKIMLGLFRHVVIEEFGEPRKIEPLKGPDGQVERHFYDGLIFEYDKLENGNVVLSAIEVVPSETAKPGPQKPEDSDSAVPTSK